MIIEKNNNLYLKKPKELDAKVKLLLEKMTLKEKFQLLSGRKFSWWVTKPIRRLGIKSMGMTDGPHGVGLHSSYRFNTKFPCAKCLSSTWNRSLSNEFGNAIAKEVRKVGRHILLAPGVNIDRTPLNGRTFEYLSEDPYLTKEIAIQIVKGIQSQRIGACLKHYAANNQEKFRHTISTEIDERTLNEIYLRAFKETVQEANPWVVMASYNKVNGVYSSENVPILKDQLINNWGFQGFIVTDWYATKTLTKPENCLKANLSLEMPKAFAYKIKYLENAFKEKKFSEEELNNAVERILRVMFLVGLFNKKDELPKGERNTKANQLIARRIAEEGIVLLKNKDNILPLDINKIKTISIAGPNARKKMGRFIYGGSAAVVPPYEITPYKGLKQKCKNKIEIIKNSEEADVCLYIGGLNHNKGNDAEDSDRKELHLPKKQIEELKSISKKNPRIILILINGGPITMSEWIDDIPAIIEAWYPGMEGGHVIADVIFGNINPSGKLPLTFPKRLQDSPAHKSQKTYPGSDKVYYKEGIFVGYRHFDKEKIEPLFAFGFGLSYTTFNYENFSISSSKLIDEQKIRASVDVINTGNRLGSEITQLYIKDDESELERPEKELINFKKTTLKPKERKTITFEISSKDLEYYNLKMKKWQAEKGSFTIFIGNSSRNIYFKGKIQYAD